MNMRYSTDTRSDNIGRGNWSRALTTVLMCTLLLSAACSGGGGDGGTPTPPATFTVSGTVFAAAGNVIDSDVNDTSTTNGDNDTFATAQTITAPAVVGGYVNVAGSGPAGNSRVAGDANDFFQVTLTSGQAVRLSLPVTAESDIELHLYDSLQGLVNSLVGVGRTGILTVPANDTYFVEVRAVAGAASYKLIVGDAAALSAASTGLKLADEFVPGQAIVRWRAGTAPAAGDGRLAMTTATTTGGSRNHLMQFDTPAQVDAVFGRLQMGDQARAERSIPHADALMQRKYDTLKIIQALRQRDDVEMAEPNYIRHPRLVPTDPRYDEQWHYRAMDLEAAWDVTTGTGVIVAVIDTGVLVDHPDLSGQLVPGYDFISDTATANDGDGADADPDDPGDEFNGGSSFHGTHVAGTVVAALNNGAGGTGVAPAARVMPVRALGIGGGTDMDIIAGILFAAGLNNQTVPGEGTRPAAPAHIINMSLGGPAPSQLLDDAISQARAAGLIIVASGGNSATSLPEYPAASDGVIAVAATDLNNQRAFYSSFGATIDVAAPGGDRGVNLDNIGEDDGVLSTGGSDDDTALPIQFVYRSEMGTSMSAPHLAGVAALMKSVRPGLTPDEMDAYLAGGLITEPLPDSGLGAGLINAQLAVAQAGLPASPTALKATPNAFNLGTATGSAVMTLEGVGGGALSVTAVTVDPDAPWLTVSDQVPDADNLGDYTLVVDRTGLAGGIYTATIEAVSTVNTVDVAVRLEVLPDASSDAGFQYALLVNPNNLSLVDKVPMTEAGGVYSFSFTGVLAGTYQIFTGTDMDNDGLSLDAGEAFGAYPSPVQPSSLTVNGDALGLNFTSGFSLDFFVTANQFFITANQQVTE